MNRTTRISIYALSIGTVSLLLCNNAIARIQKNNDIKEREIVKKIEDIEDIKEIKIPYIRETIDLYSDNSIHKYIGEKNKIARDYIPEGLEKIESEYIVSEDEQQIVFQANNALKEMAKNFYKDFQEKLFITSSYRPAKSQQHLLENGCKKNRCASIGASEHQLGLAIDIAVYTKNKVKKPLLGKYFKRMKKNAYKFGYINTYQKGVLIDGKSKEPRHRRYLGKKLATYLHTKGLSFAEYFLFVQTKNAGKEK